MRILAVADEESKHLWDYYKPGMFDGIDLILSAGDLDSSYLSFLVTMANVPLLYIHGNHDDHYAYRPPEGCICIEDSIYTYGGIRILGMGGSQRYKHGQHQFSEKEMNHRLMKMTFPLLYQGGFDILLTHAPAKNFHDGSDLPHQGFQVFNRLISKYKPSYHVHGHVHLSYDREFKRIDRNQNTTVINAFEKYIFEI